MSTYTRREIISLSNATTHKPKLNLKDVIGFRLLKVVCNNSFYNVIYDVNDIFQWTGVGGSQTVRIPAGKYDYSSFATAWETAANGAGAETFTITFDINTKLYTFTTDIAITPQWVSGSNSARNISRLAGFLNNDTGNETNATVHFSQFPAQLIPSHFLLKSNALGSGRKSVRGGGGGTQIKSSEIDHSPQDYINVLPNQVDGSLATFVYRAPDNDTESFTYNGLRVIDTIDLAIIHPWYPDNSGDVFYSRYLDVTYEIEFLCSTETY